MCRLWPKPTPIITTALDPYVIPQGVPSWEDEEKEKFAFLSGINLYAPHLNCDLRGCVNDVETYRYILINYYKLHPDNIRVLLDFRASENAIIEHMHWLVEHEDSRLICTYSGHGSDMRVRNWDARLSSKKVQLLCGSDINFDDPKLLDYKIGEIFDKKPESSSLTFFVDACHSETMTRGLAKRLFTRNNRSRYLPPPRDIQFRSESINIETSKIVDLKEAPLRNRTVVSACEDEQTAADAYINGKYQGAFTAHIAKYLRPGNTYDEHFPQFIKDIKSARFDQNPQVNGPQGLIIP